MFSNFRNSRYLNLFGVVFSVNCMINRSMVHINCRAEKYPFGDIKRLVFPDEQVPWNVDFPNYSPPEYESKVLENKPWADPPISDENFKPKWNELDGKINRKSHIGTYNIVDKRPLNPEGRTGLKGRGVLGKWGPNHAADPIVTRWKKVGDKRQVSKCTNLPILQACVIQRRDCGQWALPGGMVDPGEQISETLRREFMEETMDSLQASKEEIEKNTKMLKSFFSNGKEIFKGYVDDPRNTDNAWMETVAVNFHDDDGSSVGKFELKAGDDAKNVRWIDLDSKMNMYASHSQFLKIVAENLGAHW